MPCLDPTPEEYIRFLSGVNEELKQQKGFLEASLCATLRSLTLVANTLKISDPYMLIDFASAGVTREELEAWWVDHQAKDAARKSWEEERARREAAEAQRKALIDSALAKLTGPEREAILASMKTSG